ncbi:MAG: ATP-binding cassette domain-containing protein [Eubacteriales bacterium]
MTAAELKNVSYTYSKGTPFESAAVADVSAVFESGMITGIIGHTGSGKSTVAQLINGLLPVSSGEVFVCGKNIWEDTKKMRQVRFTAGLVFQYPEYQLFDETIYKDISFGRRIWDFPKRKSTKESEMRRATSVLMTLFSKNRRLSFPAGRSAVRQSQAYLLCARRF